MGLFHQKPSSVIAIEPEHDIRYFAYARHALSEALRLCDCGPGDVVLLPELICRDVLSSIHSVGATSRFYPVDATLSAQNLESNPPAKVVIAVNYFGFPQDLEPFNEYCSKTGAILIEDNAHGFLSKSPDGKFLGSRAPLGITSIRKTFRLMNGAALHISDSKYVSNLHSQLAYTNERPPLGVRSRITASRIQRSTRIPLLSLLQVSTRIIRKLTTGSWLPVSSVESETSLPMPINPHQSLRNCVQQLRAEKEVLRRRNLFIATDRKLKSIGIGGIFTELTPGVSPYGYAFIANSQQLRSAKRRLRGLSVEVISWPDLPQAIRVDENHFYRNLRVVNFL